MVPKSASSAARGSGGRANRPPADSTGDKPLGVSGVNVRLMTNLELTSPCHDVLLSVTLNLQRSCRFYS